MTAELAGGEIHELPLLHLISWLIAHTVKCHVLLEETIQTAANAGLTSRCTGAEKAVNVQRQTNLAELLNYPVILELETLTNVDKIFLIESLLLWIHHYRLNGNFPRERFQHGIIIEEAHHVLHRQAPGARESVVDMLFREVRELGESIVLIDQHPSLISLPALGNTNLTFTFNLKTREDVNTAANYLLLGEEQRDTLGELMIGQCLVKVQSRYPKAFLMRTVHAALKNQSIPDEEIQAHMRGYSGDTKSGIAAADGNPICGEVPSQEQTEGEATESVRDLLLDILHRAE